MSDAEKQKSAHPVRRFGWKKTLVYSLLPLVLLLALLEGAARLGEMFLPPLPVDLGLSFTPESRLFVPDPDKPRLMITNPNKTTVPDAVRAILPPDVPPEWAAAFQAEKFLVPKPKGRFRIFAVGGSSVNYAYHNLREISPRLTRQFPVGIVEMINCGGCSYGTHRLVPIVAEIMNYEPDLILLYTGHNEFEEQEQLRIAQLDTLPLQRALWSSAAMRFVRDRVVLASLRARYAEHNRKIQETPIDRTQPEPPKPTRDEVEERMRAYRRNLETMARIAQEHGVPLVIGTVASNLVAPQFFQSEDAALYAEEATPLFDRGDYTGFIAKAHEILPWTHGGQATAYHNRIIREVAAEYVLPLADVEAAVTAAEPHGVMGETLFSDHCHLNDKGKVIFAETFAERIAELLRARGIEERTPPRKAQ